MIQHQKLRESPIYDEKMWVQIKIQTTVVMLLIQLSKKPMPIYTVDGHRFLVFFT